ncbi:ASCH domain-containing protein [Leucobacter triazinivorans]|uniref:ASCH domain-containing protein n=2 Tax=Leucobacter triazinivorans TaxID=1784719 RepID=A0A4P6KIA3_9MICO|nr:ASCH domain-containing protein [Leucobacter triazinivorans]
MWRAYCGAFPEAVAAAPEYTVDRFGDHAQLADELLDLVLFGAKRATADLVDEFVSRGDALPRIGEHWIACDGSGAPRAILRSTDLRVGPFSHGDASFAAAEAEGDGSLESWQREHRRYWTRVCAARGASWSESQEIVFEHFSVVWPPEHRDEAPSAPHGR